MSSIYKNIPALFGISNKKSITQLIESIEEWNYLEIQHAIDSVEEQYKKITGQDMSSYMGLVVFTEIVNEFRTQHNTNPSEKTLKVIAECQKKVLMYHQKQYEMEKNE